MKVAILSPITWRTPPVRYGPWEQVASVLTESLVKLGIDVTLFATGDSITGAKLQSVCAKPLGDYPDDAKVWECLHISNLIEQASEFDIIHNHFDFLPLTYSRLIPTPLLTTIHGFSSDQIIPVYRKYNGHALYVSVSNSNRHPDLTYLDTVYNGINEQQFHFGDGAGEYLLFFGRIHPHKGAYEAIQIAIQSKSRLKLCGLIQDENYFKTMVLPFLDNTYITYEGNVDPIQRNHLLGNAKALLHPISFDEPFGLSVAEAMMCGTPVIAFERGSMNELILHKRTGFLVHTIGEAVAAVGKLNNISREACRAHALHKFSSEVMAKHYLKLYERSTRRSGSIKDY
ncbi:glycosyltransferase family 4 protein [Pseudoflavitalea sp. G-6-1-2]|uniref:glycosyltransferase family 4 protein n=1 Tax=Pseudoflavitalea sp. G-6-1-2 TaxID=2728841 RepID=UPI00146C0B42|nr:glycosyltransferase family 4 protein [Pseudoflavitalea sp. G-6-1-2]NML23987.1 glycosyltransferase family 4 protein [Pseudoflavitalea sp. G-6-1-2]